MMRSEPQKAKVELLRLLRAHDGNNTSAARQLGVDVATLKRWIQRLGVRAQLDQMRRRAS